MGDINFNINKIVDLDKKVTLDIDKNVKVNVNNPDILATAESDAEAFGQNALTEVDTYTYVTGRRTRPVVIATPGQVEIIGSVVPFDPNPVEDFTVIFEDVDDVNAVGALFDLNGDPVLDKLPANTPLPILPRRNNGGLAIDDLRLVDGSLVGPVEDGVLWEYENDSLFQINFFERNVDRNGDGLFEGGETGVLTLNVPRNQTFEVLFTTTGGTEIDLASTDAFFIFTPNGGAELPCNNDSVEVQADLDLVIDSLGQLAAYEVNAIGEFLWFLECPHGDGTAFAYAESTAALDLG